MIRTDGTTAPLTRPDGTPIRILAVDDESSLTELLSMAMRYEGWQVSTAASGGQAVKVARETRPDAIVLDMMLPDFDGLEVMRRIRAEDPNVPVIFLTAKGLSRRPHRRPHCRRRRLRHQTLQPGGGHRPVTRAAAPQRRRARQERLDPGGWRPDTG